MCSWKLNEAHVDLKKLEFYSPVEPLWKLWSKMDMLVTFYIIFTKTTESISITENLSTSILGYRGFKLKWTVMLLSMERKFILKNQENIHRRLSKRCLLHNITCNGHSSKDCPDSLWLNLHDHAWGRLKRMTTKANSLVRQYKFLIYWSLHLTIIIFKWNGLNTTLNTAADL